MQNNTRLMRIEQDKVLGGVCSGIAQYLAMDVTLVRLVFVVLTILGVGATIPLYAILWIVLPSTNTPQLPNTNQQQQLKANFEEMKQQAQVTFNRVKDAFASKPNADWKFDPYTGQPIIQQQAQAQNDKPRFDPYTGQPLDTK
ncbi:MAG: PspC domain-containing protein [Herpetosiphon sp.]|nr:PspC domain-containing protein [Herpetosiphon sp.]